MNDYLPTALGQYSDEHAKKVIAYALDQTMQLIFPEKYAGLCHVYAVVGANVLSVCFKSGFRPVAGVAVIPTGAGCLEMLDDMAFTREVGGAYHCWIESTGSDKTVLVDFSFGNNSEYARTCGLVWTKERVDYLWGDESQLNLAKQYPKPPDNMPDVMVWFQETIRGNRWLWGQLEQHQDEYAQITSLVLRRIRLDIEDRLNDKKCSP